MNKKTNSLVYLLILASLWGPSFLFIKIAVHDMDPIHLAMFRVLIAAIAINIILKISGKPFTRNFTFWKHVTICGFFSMAFPFMLISWGEKYIDSALASILNGLTPLFTLVLANFLIADDKMTRNKFIGTILGFGGLIILISPHFNGAMEASTLGVIAVITAAASYGIGMVYARMHLKNIPPLHAPAAQLLTASFYMIPIGLIWGGIPNFNTISFNAMGSVVILALFGTALAYVFYFKIIETASASYLSYVTYLIPIYGIILGITFLNESIASETIIGAVVILTGLMIANKSIKIPTFKKR